MRSLALCCTACLMCTSAMPIGPLRQVPRLALEELMEIEQPVLVRSPSFLAEMRAVGFENFSTIKETFGESEISVREAGRRRSTIQRKLADAFDEILAGDSETAPAMRESDGRQFFLKRFGLYRRVASAFAELLPYGYRRKLQITDSDRWTLPMFDSAAALEQTDDLEPSEKIDVAMFGAPKGYVYNLHSDMNPVLLYHMDGPKTVWLYPRAQSHLLYLRYMPENMESVSPISVSPNDEEDMREAVYEYPAFERATPVQVDLRPGEVLFIPCGWAHIVSYPEASVSVACAFTPDWLTNLDEYWRLSGCWNYTQRTPYLPEKEPVKQCWSSDQ